MTVCSGVVHGGMGLALGLRPTRLRTPVVRSRDVAAGLELVGSKISDAMTTRRGSSLVDERLISGFDPAGVAVGEDPTSSAMEGAVGWRCSVHPPADRSVFASMRCGLRQARPTQE